MDNKSIPLDTPEKYKHFQLGEAPTEEQISFFREQGFIHFESFLPQETIQLFFSEMERIQADWIKEKKKTVNGVPIVYGKDIDGKVIVQRFPFSNQFSPALSELLQSSKIKSLCNIMRDGYKYRVSEKEKDGLVINHYVNTPGSKWAQMGWHTDAVRDIFYGQKVRPMLNIGLHLDDTTQYNGRLCVLPGTHNKGIGTLLFKKTYFLNKKADKSEVAVKVKAGDLTVHDGRMWHRAAAGTVVGEKSRRRVMYFPIITGEVKEKNKASKPAFYHHLVGRGFATSFE